MTSADRLAADREWYEERAGILEFDAGLSRRNAEIIAGRLLGARFRRDVEGGKDGKGIDRELPVS